MTGQVSESTSAECVLLVGLSGGHLTQFCALAPWFSTRERSWVTFATQDAVSRLGAERVPWAHHPKAKNVPGMLRNFVLAWRSRPAGTAGRCRLDGRRRRAPFFGSAASSAGRGVCPSDRPTGFAHVDGASMSSHLYPVLGVVARATRPAPAVDSRWAFDVMRHLEDGTDEVGERLLVLLGTDHHPFDRLPRWVESWLDEFGADAPGVLVQHGFTAPPTVSRARARYVPLLGHADLASMLSRAPAVVCHGGPGTIADCRHAGLLPVVAPRSAAMGEHEDDHQLLYMRRVHRDGLALRRRRAELPCRVRCCSSPSPCGAVGPRRLCRRDDRRHLRPARRVSRCREGALPDLAAAAAGEATS